MDIIFTESVKPSYNSMKEILFFSLFYRLENSQREIMVPDENHTNCKWHEQPKRSPILSKHKRPSKVKIIPVK